MGDSEMRRKRFFKGRQSGNRLYPPLLVLSVLIVVSTLLAASHSMWSSSLEVSSEIRTGFFKATICKYKVAATHSCGCLNISAQLSDDNKTLTINLEPHSGNTTLCVAMVVRNAAPIPVVLSGVDVDTGIPHGLITEKYYGVFNASMLCGGHCVSLCPPEHSIEEGIPLTLRPGEAAVAWIRVPDLSGGGEIHVRVESRPAG